MKSGPVVCMIWEGKDVVKAGRLLVGATNPIISPPGTIRGDFGIDAGRNIVHASDSVESAEKQIDLWFGNNQIIEWKSCQQGWIND